MRLHRESLPETLPAEPLAVAADWLAEAARDAVSPNPNAMVLATADADAVPSARVVLCKEIRPEHGYLTFFTNYRSGKGRDLESNPRAAVVMHWDTLRRQVRIEGPVTRTSAAESDAYFAARPWQSRIGAWASQQSEPIASHAALADAVTRTALRLGLPSPLAAGDAAADPGIAIPRPPHWGGYHLWAEVVELWVEGDSRLHDRARWTRTLERLGEAYAGGPWTATRLQP